MNCGSISLAHGGTAHIARTFQNSIFAILLLDVQHGLLELFFLKQHYAIILKIPAVQADFRRLFSFENEEGEKLTYSLKGTFYPEEQAIVYNLDDVKPKEEKKRQRITRRNHNPVRNN